MGYDWLFKILPFLKSSNTDEWKALTAERVAMADERKSVTQEIRYLKDEYKDKADRKSVV